MYVTEVAYAQLKESWRVLLQKNESDKEHVRTATLACMVLQNVCLLQADSIPRKLDLSFGPDGKEKGDMREWKSVHEVSGEATRVRDALCRKLWVERETGRVS